MAIGSIDTLSIQALLQFSECSRTPTLSSGRKILQVVEVEGNRKLQFVQDKEVIQNWGFIQYVESFFEVGGWNLAAVVQEIGRKGLIDKIEDRVKRDQLIDCLNEKIKKHNCRWIKFRTIAEFPKEGSVEERLNQVAIKIDESPACGQVLDKKSGAMARAFDRELQSIQDAIQNSSGEKRLFDQVEVAFSTLSKKIERQFSEKIPPLLQGKVKMVGGLISVLKQKLAFSKEHYIIEKKRNIIRQKADGNCLYYSFSQGLEFQGGTRSYATRLHLPLPAGEKYSSDELRRFVHRYFQEHVPHDERLKDLIKEAIYQQNLAQEDVYNRELATFVHLFFKKAEEIFKAGTSVAEPLAPTFKELQKRGRLLDAMKAKLSLQEFYENVMMMIVDFSKNIRGFVSSGKVTRTSLKEQLLPVIEEITQLENLVKESFNRFQEKWIKMPHFEEISSDEGRALANRGIDEYIRRSLNDRNWGSMCELYALSRIFKIDVSVSKIGRSGTRELDRQAMAQIEGVSETLGSIHLDFENNEHFNIVID